MNSRKLPLLPVATSNISEAINYCGDVLIAVDLDETNEQQLLMKNAVVPDEYKTWQRIIGLYPLSALAFSSGINSWHKETNTIYAQPLNTLGVQGELLRYEPSSNNKQLSSSEIKLNINNINSENALNIPTLSNSDKQTLFNHYAPIFEIDLVTNNDRIGTVELDNDKYPHINTELPNVYQQLSYTRVANKILLQLNYTIWFPARPIKNAFDMLGGHLDGITWRVTLLPDGNPWLYDSMHNCGCYHLFFPTQYTTILPQEPTLNETAFIPQTLTIQAADRPIVHG